jgi:glycosyltransferase involved in cell wall biosynthesis
MGKPITVCIDIRDLKIAKTGARTYLDEIKAVFEQDQDPRFRFIFLNNRLPLYTGRNSLLKLIEHVRFFCWKQCILPLKAWLHGADILLCTDFFVPWLRIGFQTIPVFHDAFFWEYPEHYNRYWRWLFVQSGLAAARKSRFIITPTAYTQQTIARLTALPINTIIPIHEAAKSGLLQTNTPTEWKQLLNHPYILHVGTFEKRKNLLTLLQAFKQLKTSGKYADLQLVLVGQQSPKTNMDGFQELSGLLKDPAIADAVHCTGYIPDSQLGWFYAHAAIYIFPSVNEGFGIPVLEAMQHKTPVVIANNSCLPEVAGDAAIAVDPYDSAAFAQAIDHVLSDEALRDSMIEKGLQRAQQFSWQKTCAQLKAVFIRTIN